MSTQIKTIKGTYHEKVSGSFRTIHGDAEINIFRFFNGEKRGANVQITTTQYGIDGESSYIHLNEKQCKKLSKFLLECFDYTKHPSD